MISKNLIKINLSTTPLENHSIYVMTTLILLIVALILTFSNVYDTMSVINKKREASKVTIELNAKIKSNELKIKALQSNISSIKTKEFSEKCDYVNTIVNKRVFSWTQLFNEFEEILPNSVRMIQVTPSIEKGEIKIALAVAAQNLESFLELLKRLESSKVFKNVIVSRETTKERELTYELSMQYNPFESSKQKQESKGAFGSGKT